MDGHPRRLSEHCGRPSRGAVIIAFPHSAPRPRFRLVFEWEWTLGALTRQGMRGRRIGDLEESRRAIETWAPDGNERQPGVDWQMTRSHDLWQIGKVKDF